MIKLMEIMSAPNITAGMVERLFWRKWESDIDNINFIGNKMRELGLHEEPGHLLDFFMKMEPKKLKEIYQFLQKLP